MYTVENSWWWAEELSETCRVSFQNKFEKLVHLVALIIRTCHDARSREPQNWNKDVKNRLSLISIWQHVYNWNVCIHSYIISLTFLVDCVWNVMTQAQKSYFVFRRNGRVHYSVQSTTGSRGVRISGSNAGYTVFRSSVKSTGYPLHSPLSPSFPLPYVTVCHHISTGVYSKNVLIAYRVVKLLRFSLVDVGLVFHVISTTSI
jgi:hypothetical protein